METLTKLQLTTAEKVCAAAGVTFLLNVLLIAFSGNMALLYLAKGFYVAGILLLIFKD